MKKLFLFILSLSLADQTYSQITTSKVKVEQTGNITSIDGPIGVGTSSPDSNAGLHMFQNKYTLYGPNSTWGAYLQVGGNGRTTSFASVVATNGNLHLDSKEGYDIYLNHYSAGNTLLNTQGGNVGVGTSSPNSDAGLHMYQNRYTLYGPNSTWGAYLQVGGNGRTTNFASVVVTNGNLHLDSKEGYNIYLNHYSQGNTFLNTQGGNVGIGTSSPSHRLEVNGSIKGTTLHTSTQNWSDFVFYDNYSLRTLEELEKHIKEKGHLPEIPSEAEVTENGINLGEMDAKLLQKVEELTLYMIDINKQVQQLRSENRELKEKVNRLESK